LSDQPIRVGVVGAGFWATEMHLSLGQVAVDEDSNEITAIPRLLELLDLKGALVTIDAIGCQTEIAEQIIAGKGDYVLVVKGNQEHLQADILATLEHAEETNYQGVNYSIFQQQEDGHGKGNCERAHRRFEIPI